MRRLENEVRELRQRGRAGSGSAGASESAPAEPLLEVIPADPAPAESAAAAIEIVPEEPAVTVPSFDLEDWIGRRGLGWAAVVLLLFATAFFLKYAFDNQWIGELGRVALGVTAGMALAGIGYRYHCRGWRIFSQMLTSAGVVLLYLTTFASFGYYHLLPQSQAGAFLVVLIAESAALAILYEAPAIALMAVCGGLLNPVLLRTSHDQYVSLFIYLTVLDLGVVTLLLLRRWHAIGTTALLGTQLLFWSWYAINFHPEKHRRPSSFRAPCSPSSSATAS